MRFCVFRMLVLMYLKGLYLVVGICLSVVVWMMMLMFFSVW